MIGLTLSLAVIASLLAYFTSPRRALWVYCGSLLLYPQALTVPIGSADFSLGRVCILAVLANAIVRHRRDRSFEWMWVDVFLFASWALGFVALLQTFPTVAPERHAGQFFDTLLPYLAVRLILRSREDLVSFVQGLAVIAVPITVLAVSQMLTGRNPIGFLAGHYAFGLEGNRAEEPVVRVGLHRAAVTFTHPTSLGLFCAMVTTLTLSLWTQRAWPRWVVAAAIGSACVGLFTSLSNGPLLAVAGAAFVLVLHADRRLAAALVALAVVSVVSIAAYSGEPVADVLSDLAYNPVSAQYRIGLVSEALGGGMDGYWWTGYGYVGFGPGTDNAHFHWYHGDLVNLYVQTLVRTGLLGLVPFLFANVLLYACLVKALRTAATPEAGWLAWCLLASMSGWNLALLTVGIVSQTSALFYMTIASSVNAPIIVSPRVVRES